MYVDDPAMRDLLGRMVQTISSSPVLWDDLLQESLIHLWIIEGRRPGQTRSWYLQSCKYHLLHYLNSGRSIDSMKRRDSRVAFEPDADGSMEFFDLPDPGASVLSCVSARELVSLLSCQLLPQERLVLDCLADGLGIREIGRKLKLSHTMVIKHRCKIADLLSRLDRNGRPGLRPNHVRKTSPAADRLSRTSTLSLFPNPSTPRSAQPPALVAA